MEFKLGQIRMGLFFSKISKSKWVIQICTYLNPFFPNSLPKNRISVFKHIGSVVHQEKDVSLFLDDISLPAMELVHLSLTTWYEQYNFVAMKSFCQKVGY